MSSTHGSTNGEGSVSTTYSSTDDSWDDGVSSVGVQAPTRLDYKMKDKSGSSSVQQMASLGDNTPSIYTSKGVEVQLDSETYASTTHHDLDTAYTEQEDEVASVSVQAPSRVDQSVQGSVDSDALRKVTRLSRKYRKQSTNKYMKKFTSRSSKIKVHPPSNKIQSISTLPNSSGGGPKSGQSNSRSFVNNEGISSVNDLEAQLKNVIGQLKKENRRGVTITSKEGSSYCIGNKSSNHVIKIIVLLVLYCVVATALGGLLLQQFFRIPGAF